MCHHINKTILLAILPVFFVLGCAGDKHLLPKDGENESITIKNAGELLVGTWRDKNSTATYLADGTRYTKYDNGDESFGTWSIQGDILTDVINKYKTKQGRVVVMRRMYRAKVVYLDENRYRLKYDHDSAVWDATRIMEEK